MGHSLFCYRLVGSIPNAVRAMEQVHHFYRIFHCWYCSHPIVLQADTLGPQGSNQAPRSKETQHAVAVCPSCRLVGMYSADKGSPHHDPRVKVVAGIQNEALDFFRWLDCDGGDQCSTRLPMYARLSSASTAELLRKEMESWGWRDLHCPSNHPLHRPK